MACYFQPPLLASRVARLLSVGVEGLRAVGLYLRLYSLKVFVRRITQGGHCVHFEV